MQQNSPEQSRCMVARDVYGLLFAAVWVGMRRKGGKKRNGKGRTGSAGEEEKYVTQPFTSLLLLIRQWPPPLSFGKPNATTLIVNMLTATIMRCRDAMSLGLSLPLSRSASALLHDPPTAKAKILSVKNKLRDAGSKNK